MKLSVNIKATKENVWKIITDIENCDKHIEGIEKVEILNKPEKEFVGLKWRETRNFLGQTATEVMWITDSVENEYYTVRAESHGAIYTTNHILSKDDDSTVLTMTFDAELTTFKAKLVTALTGWMFVSATKKALLKDLNDIKKASEAIS